MSVTIKTVRHGLTTERQADYSDGLLSCGIAGVPCRVAELLDYLATRHDAAYVVDASGKVIAEAHRMATGARCVIA